MFALQKLNRVMEVAKLEQVGACHFFGETRPMTEWKNRACSQ